MTEDRADAGAALLALQAEDLALDRLAYRRAHLPERAAELGELGRRREMLEFDRGPIRAAQGELRDQQEALEREIAEAGERLRAIEVRSRSGDAGSFRDQEAMANEMAAIARRIRELEDEELSVMEAMEPHETALATLSAEEASVLETRRLLQDGATTAESAIAEEVAEVERRRANAAAEVPEALRSEYDRLRARLGGIGVAEVVHGTCSGCNLRLSATQLDRVHHLGVGSLEHCEQCGRLLVPAP